jgi:hypothetical protein
MYIIEIQYFKFLILKNKYLKNRKMAMCVILFWQICCLYKVRITYWKIKEVGRSNHCKCENSNQTKF